MKDLHTPESIYRGTDFWMLNGALREDELARQLEEMHSQGVASVIARTYIGLQSDYPGEDFMSKTAVILREAKKHGMTVFLQAGYMPEAVLDLPAEYALDYLCACPIADKPADADVLLERDGFVYYRRCSVTALNLFDKASMEYYIRQSYDLWQRFSDEFGKTVLSVWVDEPSYHATHLPWFAELENIFAEKYGYSLRERIDALYFDVTGCEKVRYDYWTLLQKLLEINYFAMLRDWCNRNGLWFSGHLMTEDTLSSQISRACAVMPYYKYFDIPGIDILTGIMKWREDPLIQPGGPDYGNDGLFTTPIQCVSAAHQAGKDHILCEMYGVTSNGMGFRDFAHYFDHYASLGINHRSVHGIFYSLHGRSKRTYPPHVNYYQPYWKKYRDLTDYCARTAAFLSQGKPFARTLVVQPLESAYCVYHGPLDGSYSQATAAGARLDRLFNALLRTLCAHQLSFELGDLNTLSTDFARVENGKLIVGEMEYETVVLPWTRVLSREVSELLRRFAKAGGRILTVGDRPEMLDGNPCAAEEILPPETEYLPELNLLVRRLTELGDDCRIECKHGNTFVRVYHTRKGNERYFMLFNSDCARSQQVSLHVPGNYDMQRFLAEDGSLQTLASSFDGSETTLRLTLPEGGSMLLLLTERNDAEIRSLQDVQTSCVTIPISDFFQIQRHAPNALLMEYCSFRTENMECFEGPYTALAVNRILREQNYHGKLIQRFEFESRIPFGGLTLALEDAAECNVFLNGEAADVWDGKSYYWAKEFQTVRLPNACRVGMNTLEIQRDFQPLSTAKSAITSLFETQRGCELEAVYLLGDFGVYALAEPTSNGLRRYSRHAFLDVEKPEAQGELEGQGLLFYAGTISLTNTFSFAEDPSAFREILLQIGEFHGCVAEAFINGVSAGDLWRYPYAVSVRSLLRSGENALTIRLTNTLRPLLGPYHRPLGEIGNAWNGSYDDPDSAWTGSANGPEWYKRTETDSSVWTDCYNQVPLGVLSPSLVCRK